MLQCEKKKKTRPGKFRGFGKLWSVFHSKQGKCIHKEILGLDSEVFPTKGLGVPG